MIDYQAHDGLKIFIILFFSVIFFLGGSYAQNTINSTSSLQITVNVSQKTIISIYPSSLSWTGSDSVEPGETGVNKQVLIENLGSTNISYIWFNTTYPKNDPFGTGHAANYDPGNFVKISRQGLDKYYHANRIDYNSSYTIIYLSFPAPSNHAWWYGKFRDGGREYFWGVDKVAVLATGANCSVDGTIFRIGVNWHNETEEGSVDLSGGCDDFNATNPVTECRSGTLQASSEEWQGQEWSFAHILAGNNTFYQNYTVAVNEYCNTTYWGVWNVDGPGGGPGVDDNADQYFADDANPLYPGGGLVADVVINVPYGVAWGQVSTGTLTVIAQAVDVEA